MILAAPAKPGMLVEKYHLLKWFLMRDVGWARNDEPRGKQQQPIKPEGQRRKHTTDHPALQTICTTTSVSLRDAGGVLVRVPSTRTLLSFRKDKQRAHQGIQHPSTFGHPGHQVKAMLRSCKWSQQHYAVPRLPTTLAASLLPSSGSPFAEGFQQDCYLSLPVKRKECI